MGYATKRADLMGISPSIAKKIVAKSDFLVKPLADKDGDDYLGYARARAKDFPMVQSLPPDFDPDNLPEDFTTRTDQVRDSKGVMRDVVRYLSPRRGRDFTYLQPFAEGSGWRTTNPAPSNPRFYDELPDDWEKDPEQVKIMDDAIESYDERLQNFEDEALPDIIDTADHETGHVATQSELYNNEFWQDPSSIFTGLSSDEKSKVMARMLDDPKFARARMREPRQPFPNRFSDKSTRQAWHEKAAYTTEFPFNPEYAAAKWLHHYNVEQPERRAYLESVARAQKKWGVENPINAQRMARELNPKRKGGRRPGELRGIMGTAPERKPGMPLSGDMPESDWQPITNPDAERILLPPQERIYRNLRNAILQQGAGILDESGSYATDLTGMTPSTYYDENTGPRRKKMAEQFTSEAMSALDSHFKDVLAGNAPVPKTIADLPDNVKGEIGRLQLRRILAGQVGDQTRLRGDVKDWKDPDYGYVQDWRQMNEREYPMVFDLFDREMGKYGDSPMNPSLSRLARLGLLGKRPNGSSYSSRWDESNPYFKLYRKWQELRDEAAEKTQMGGEYSNHHRNEAMIAAIRQDYSEGHPWKYEKGSGYKKPGPNEQAVIDEIERNKATDQQVLLDYAKELGIEEDIMNINKPKTFPDMMRSDMEFVEFDPENNPEHREVLENFDGYFGNYYRGEYFPENTPRSMQSIYNLFPSLQYGLIPKQALEPADDERRSNNVNLKYKLPEMKRTYKGKEWNIEEDGLPHQTRTGRYDDKEISDYDFTGEKTNLYDTIPSYERDRYEPIEEQLIPHPLAGKPMSSMRNVGLESPERWKVLTDKGDAFKQNRRDYSDSDYTDMRANVNRFDDLDIPSFISEMAEKDGITFNEAYNKYYIQGHEDYYNGDEEGGLFFGLKSKKPRHTPQQAGSEQPHKYDPVSRAIAQAFMDSEYEREKWAKDDDDMTSERMTEKEREMNPAFGGEPYDSEFKRRENISSDDWDLDSYVQQLKNPESDEPSTWNQRKNLTDILSEIADRRLKDAGFEDWRELDTELKQRERDKDLEDED